MIGKIYIHGEVINVQDKTIGDFGYVSLASVMKQVEQQPKATSFDVHIHSVGGDVQEGFAIYNFLKNTGKEINTYSDGLVASIATVIFMAGEKRYIHKLDSFLIHNPWGMQVGEAEDFEKYASMLRDYENKAIDFYASFVNISKDEIRNFMKQETYLTTEQLISFGFATDLIENYKAVAKININKTEKQMSELKKEDVEGMFNGFFAKVVEYFKPKAKMVQDAEGNELHFPDVPEDGTPIVGDKTTAKDGDYLLPSGETYVIAGGILTEIKPVDKDEDEDEKPNEEIEALKAKIAELEAQASAKSQVVKDLEKEVKTIKASISGKFIYDEKQENSGEQEKTRTFKTK